MFVGVTEAVTNGIRVSIRTNYLEDQSVPSEARFAFAYTVRISNESEATVQLRSRHWIITDSNEDAREVKGEGVVGEQPVLSPGQAFEYTSGCVLPTSWGTMQGTYRFVSEGAASFDAEIPAFLLVSSAIESVREAN